MNFILAVINGVLFLSAVTFRTKFPTTHQEQQMAQQNCYFDAPEDGNGDTTKNSTSSFVSLYMSRLKLNDNDEDSDKNVITKIPSFSNLCTLVEAHLSEIPFENLSQHGCGEVPSLSKDVCIDKILRRNRGGFCYELNGLFSYLLEALGYGVSRVNAFVHAGADVGFRDEPTHLVLIVTIPPPLTDNNDSSNKDNSRSKNRENDELERYFVDVGFGEPPIHPLKFKFSVRGQLTPDGMKSRFVEQRIVPQMNNNDDNNNEIILQWWNEDIATWAPRLKFIKGESLTLPHTSPGMEEFELGLQRVLDKTSIFHQKLIVCKVTRNEKVSIAGSRLKHTGPPRFGSLVPVCTSELENVKFVQEELHKTFGIPLDETSNLDLTKSKASPAGLWSQY